MAIDSPVRLYLFGDQTYDVADTLQELTHVRDDALVSDFLEKASGVLKHEVSCLTAKQREQCPRFARILDLLPYYRAGTLNPALVQALTCVAQLGLFLQQHGSQGRAFPSADDACVAGICTGALAATAVSYANTIAALLSLGLHAVAVAVRLGAVAWETASRISADYQRINADGTCTYASWTSAISGYRMEDLEKSLSMFVEEKKLSRVSAPYVSATVGQTSASIAGAPGAIADFLAWLSSSNPSKSSTTTTSSPTPTTTASLRIPAPYHAAHLYTDADVAHVLRGVPDLTIHSPIPLIAASSDAHDGATSSQPSGKQGPFTDALELAVRDCLSRRIALDELPNRIVDHVRSRGSGDDKVSIALHPVAVSTAELRRVEPTIKSLLGDDGVSHSLPPAPLNGPAGSNGGSARSKLAILSASGRFPHADDMNAFWQILLHGVDTHELAPASRWDTSAHVGSDPYKLAKNQSGTGFGCWLHNAGQFDAAFFNMSPREAPQVDPAQRLALLTATEALEQAGIVPNRTASTQKTRVGVYYGSTSNDWMETNSAQNVDTYFIPGGNRAFIPGRINYHHKFSGPSYTIDTACSSSLAALHMACNALWRGEIDTAIVGGTNVLTNPDMTAGLDRGHFLSRTGNCKTFDESADGYCRGEAVVTVILKRLDDALIDKDPIQACILGVATNHNAEAESITRPHAAAQKELFEHLLAETGVSANDISYVEMHGTGTQAGDAGETTSVVTTLSPLTSRGTAVRPASQPLHIGAAKSNVGHGEAAAGVTSLAKVLLMLKHNKIPPHAGIKTKLNPKLPELQPRNTFIALQETNWEPQQDKKRRVLLNNFSAAGGNTAVILEDPPSILASYVDDPRSAHMITVSAKTPESMISNIRNLIQWIDSQGLQDDAQGHALLAKLSYTTTARRVHHRHRIVLTASSISQLRTQLNEHLQKRLGGEKSLPVPPKAPGVIFCFTGQGCPYAGMGVDLYSQFSSIRADINSHDKLCVQMGLPSIRPLFEESTAVDAFETVSPTMLQVSHACFQMALFNLWQSFGIQARAVVGHSLGEYAALYAAGALSEADVIFLSGTRAQLMERRLSPNSHAMLVVHASEEAVIAALPGQLGQDYELSCRNGSKNVVLGGTAEQMNTARAQLEERGIRGQYLDTSFAFHTAQVDPILEAFSSASIGARVTTPKIPVISPTYGKVLRHATDFEKEYFVQHCRNMVNMVGALTAAKDESLFEGATFGIEVGPAPVVINMAKEAAGPSMQTFPSLHRGRDTTVLFANAIAKMYASGVNINWTQYHEDFPGCQEVLDLPAYGWTLKEYWLQYVNSWSLRKGDPPLVIAAASLETSSIHSVISNTIQGNNDGEVIADADLNREDLHPMVQGHKVYGVPLCTPSVYADIALTLGYYIKQATGIGGPETIVEVGDMHIQSALVANDADKQQLLRSTAKFDAKKKAASLTFSSVDGNGKILEQHANCQIRFADLEASKRELKAAAAHAQAQMKALQVQVGENGSTYRFSKPMIYKMITELADFDPKYRALSAITLNNDTREAAGTVHFKGIASEGKWTTSPAYLDALSQLGGFVMNAHEGVDLQKELFVNHGWRSMKLFAPLDPNGSYYSYVQMSEGKDKLWEGDVILFDQKSNLIGTFGGVALQGVPKRLMTYIVNAANKKVSGSASAPKAAAKAEKAQSVAKPQVQVQAPRPAATVTAPVLKTVAVAKPPSQPSVIPKAMEIVAEEVGVEVAELTDDLQFADAGLDSLLGLVISSRMRDELSIEFESSEFLEVGTIGGLKQLILKLAPEQALSEVSPAPAAVPLAAELVVPAAPVVTVPALPIAAAETAPVSNERWSEVVIVLSEESGLSEDELGDEVAFADIGVDSLLSLVISSRLRDELDLDLPDQLFEACPTVADLRRHLFGADTPAPVSPDLNSESPSSAASDSGASSVQTPSVAETPLTDISIGEGSDYFISRSKPTPPRRRRDTTTPSVDVAPAWSMYLQGSAKRSTQTLFLFPDGCGAATSYLSLPTLAPNTAVVGFNSPFMKTPHRMADHSFHEVISSYIAGLRSRQPRGPYHLGGWSAGGILAYAIAQELLAAGEKVSSLLLIDSPPPTRGLDRLPDRFFDHCTSVGLFGTEMQRGSEPAKPPEWLMPHFRAQIELLHDYRAPPMPAHLIKDTKITIVWAGECAFDGVRYPLLPPAMMQGEDTEGMKFLTERRQDLGAGEWKDLFPGADLTVKTVDGEHHFSMMREKGAGVLAGYMREGLGI